MERATDKEETEAGRGLRAVSGGAGGRREAQRQAEPLAFEPETCLVVSWCRHQG